MAKIQEQVASTSTSANATASTSNVTPAQIEDNFSSLWDESKYLSNYFLSYMTLIPKNYSSCPF
jgi:hypothetical protein